MRREEGISTLKSSRFPGTQDKYNVVAVKRPGY